MRTVCRIALYLVVVASIGYSPAAFAAETQASAALAAEMAVADASGMVRRPDGSRCPALNVLRTPEEVFADRIAAIQAGDIDAVMCTYAPDAIVVMPSGVTAGLANIRSAFEMMTMMLGGETPTIDNVVVAEAIVMTTFHYAGAMFSIPDGSDTYVIHHGYIRFHTAHNTVVFNAPPAP